MRSFEQRMEEIHRRSERIIKQRKKRWLRFAAVCVPTVLCIVAVFVLPIVMPENTEDPGASNDISLENYTYMSSSISYVEVSGTDISRTVSSPMAVEQILMLLSAEESPEINSPTQAELSEESADCYKNAIMDNGEINVEISHSSSASYTITVYTQSGAQTIYCLTGNHLKSLETGDDRILTKQELYELKILLGIEKGA